MAQRDNDKYPAETGRRRFVKGVVGAASLGAIATGTGVATTSLTSSSGKGGGTTQFKAIENTDGPAPRGMPQIPIEINDNDEIIGRWPEPEEVQEGGQTHMVSETDIGGVTYSTEWFQYCGVQTYEGIDPEADQDNVFVSSPDSSYEWQSELGDGEALTVSHFDDYEEWGNDIGQSGLGKPAKATWRSEGTETAIPVQVMRSSQIEEMAQNDEWLQASTDQGIMAWLNKCTHYCCVPGYKTNEGSAAFGAEDQVYCQCHQSVYNPFSIVEKTFTAFPRPSDSSSGEDDNSSGGE